MGYEGFDCSALEGGSMAHPCPIHLGIYGRLPSAASNWVGSPPCRLKFRPVCHAALPMWCPVSACTLSLTKGATANKIRSGFVLPLLDALYQLEPYVRLISPFV